MVQNQHYDESVEVSDGEEVASSNRTPREGPGRCWGRGDVYMASVAAPPPLFLLESTDGGYRYPSQQPLAQGAGGVVGSMTYEEEEDESGEEQSESEEEEEEEGPLRTLSGWVSLSVD